MKNIIVVDMQKGFLDNSSYIKLNKRLEDFLQYNKYDNVFLTKFLNNKTKNSFYQNKLNYKKLTTKQEQEISLTTNQKTLIFEKYGYGLQQKDLEYLKSLKIKEIDVCGVKLDACVYAISLQLFDAGIYPNVLWNYCDCNKKLRKGLKEIYIRQFGKVDERKI